MHHLNVIVCFSAGFCRFRTFRTEPRLRNFNSIGRAISYRSNDQKIAFRAIAVKPRKRKRKKGKRKRKKGKRKRKRKSSEIRAGKSRV